MLISCRYGVCYATFHVMGLANLLGLTSLTVSSFFVGCAGSSKSMCVGMAVMSHDNMISVALITLGFMAFSFWGLLGCAIFQKVTSGLLSNFL